MIARIAKRFTFDAAHFLPGLPTDHPCSRMHGHTYEVELQLVGPFTTHQNTSLATHASMSQQGYRGFVLDYADIAKSWRDVHAKLDHNVLNDVEGLEMPSTEVLAHWIIAEIANHPALLVPIPVPKPNSDPSRKCTLLERVIVKESSTTWCEMLVDEVFDIKGCQTRWLTSWCNHVLHFGEHGRHSWIQWARCGFPADSSGF